MNEIETNSRIKSCFSLKTTNDDNIIRKAFVLDEAEKEQLRKERRRLQEQLRRVKRNEAARRVYGKNSADKDSKPPKNKYKKDKAGGMGDTSQISMNDSIISGANEMHSAEKPIVKEKTVRIRKDSN